MGRVDCFCVDEAMFLLLCDVLSKGKGQYIDVCCVEPREEQRKGITVSCMVCRGKGQKKQKNKNKKKSRGKGCLGIIIVNTLVKGRYGSSRSVGSSGVSRSSIVVVIIVVPTLLTGIGIIIVILVEGHSFEVLKRCDYDFCCYYDYEYHYDHDYDHNCYYKNDWLLLLLLL